MLQQFVPKDDWAVEAEVGSKVAEDFGVVINSALAGVFLFTKVGVELSTEFAIFVAEFVGIRILLDE